ncbi:MAG: MarR family transcriptional regulator [Anaerolineae bacterium]
MNNLMLYAGSRKAAQRLARRKSQAARSGRSKGVRDQTTRDVYQFLWKYFQEHGFAPTQQEIARECYLAQSSVSRHLDKLARWGWLEREGGRSRALHLLKPLDDSREG